MCFSPLLTNLLQLYFLWMIYNIKGATVLYYMLDTFGLPIYVQSLLYTPNYLIFNTIAFLHIPLFQKYVRSGYRILYQVHIQV